MFYSLAGNVNNPELHFGFRLMLTSCMMKDMVETLIIGKYLSASHILASPWQPEILPRRPGDDGRERFQSSELMFPHDKRA